MHTEQHKLSPSELLQLEHFLFSIGWGLDITSNFSFLIWLHTEVPEDTCGIRMCIWQTYSKTHVVSV